MCACGRKKNQVTTTIQAEQEAQAARASLEAAERQVLAEAEHYVRSATNAIGNASS